MSIEDTLKQYNIDEENFPDYIKKWIQSKITGEVCEINKIEYKPIFKNSTKEKMVNSFFLKLFNKNYGRNFIKKNTDKFIKLSENINNSMEFEMFLKELKIDNEHEKVLFNHAMEIYNTLRKPKNTIINGEEFEVELDYNQQEEFINYFMENDFKKLMQSEIQKLINKTGNAFDESFFKNWTQLCIRLKENYNLHNKLPNIINTFFAKRGLDITSSKDEGKKALLFSCQERSVSNEISSDDASKPKFENKTEL